MTAADLVQNYALSRDRQHRPIYRVPLDLNILKALKRPPRGFHLYLWLTYRTGRGRALGRHRAHE